MIHLVDVSSTAIEAGLVSRGLEEILRVAVAIAVVDAEEAAAREAVQVTVFQEEPWR